MIVDDDAGIGCADEWIQCVAIQKGLISCDDLVQQVLVDPMGDQSNRQGPIKKEGGPPGPPIKGWRQRLKGGCLNRCL